MTEPNPTLLIAVDPGLRAGAMVFQYVNTADVFGKREDALITCWPDSIPDNLDDIAIDTDDDLALTWYKNFDADDLTRFYTIYTMINGAIMNSCCHIYDVVLTIERPGHVRGHARKLVGIYWAAQLAVVNAIEQSGRMHTTDTEPQAATILQVSPGSLKKFISGNGRCPKSEIIAHVQRKWSKEYENYYDGSIMNAQIADAYGLYKMGRAWIDGDDDNLEYEKDAMSAIEVVDWSKINNGK